MGEGQIRCCGSSLYLKEKFGGGYKLVIEKKADSTADNQEIIDFIGK